jgi:DNA-binding CsgD family transcriptional regulator
MDIHKSAATTPRGRYEIVRRAALGESRAEIARALGISAKTAALKGWVPSDREPL